ncbi:hypothetical protein DSO57_1022939 [Entomophthora muscae]|uniref:Uncharacterized protein n=1 Tax=Entomophthora muscae TaxID=34485 RepID=A0ACC2UNN8_9FUNG|nr:hypothetical protein DSO57_1022939 [Entomophthora muscae]
MKGISFLFWFLAFFLPVVLVLENPTLTTDWHNSSPDNAQQKESLAHGWFKYPSGHWGRKFYYGCSSTPLPTEPFMVRPYAPFYLLTSVVGYYLLVCFSSMIERFAYLGHLGHLAMITVPIGSVIASLKLGALIHQWIPDTSGEYLCHLEVLVGFFKDRANQERRNRIQKKKIFLFMVLS